MVGYKWSAWEQTGIDPETPSNVNALITSWITANFDRTCLLCHEDYFRVVDMAT